MPTLYIKEQRTVLRKRGGRLVVEKEGQKLLEIPLRTTSAVAIFGNVQVTTQALAELLDRDIPLALYTRNGRLKGHLAPEASRNIPLRIAHYRTALDEAASFPFAQRIVEAKIANSAALLREHRANHPDPRLDAAIAQLRESHEHTRACTAHPALLGCEGAAARAYFEAFTLCNRSTLPFPGRVKHPATDPINALLSLGYSMVGNELRALAEGAGLEPYLGFLHRVDYGRASLALDLVEPFRAPLVDRLTLKLVNDRILREDDFARRVSGTESGSVILAPGAWERYLGHYEGAASELRAEMAAQVESLAASLREEGAEFLPYLCST
jgi:CRISPR-associated protein Cas1